MKASKAALAVLSVTLLASPRLQARIEPSFDLEHCAWHATDIVVASEGEAIDGTLSVLSVLAGELEKDDCISIPELDQFRSKESRTVRPLGLGRRSAYTNSSLVLSGDRLMLFLKRSEDVQTEDKSTSGPVWCPASRFGSMKVSVVWIKDDRVYGFTQAMSRGPSILTKQESAEDEMERRVISIVKIRSNLGAAGALTETSRKAQEAAVYVDSALYYAQAEAFRLLADCGADALPYLRTILRDKSRVRLHDEAVKALGAAGGESVVPELTAIVEKQLSFWRKIAPELKKGWWNGEGLEREQMGPLRDRYCVVLEVFYTLRKIKSPACRTAVQDFRDFWRSLPQLEDKSGLDQMSQACDAVLEAIPRKRRKEACRTYAELDADNRAG